jgi:cytochrome c-type biogenesis protein CcmH/NrfF
MGIKEKPRVRRPMSEVNRLGRERARRGPRTADLGLRTLILVVGLLAASMILGDTARTPTLEAIGNEVQCTCGCNAPLNGCPHIDCAEKAQEQAFIKKEIAEGKDETAILQDMSIKYGLQVLSTPPAHGFNRSIWILPGVGLLAGLALVIFIARRWKRKPADVPPASPDTLDAKVLAAMEDEMKSAGMK